MNILSSQCEIFLINLCLLRNKVYEIPKSDGTLKFIVENEVWIQSVGIESVEICAELFVICSEEIHSFPV